MAGIMILFFGVIVTVNMTMAVFATRTFGGKVVENSYVASQQFNEWLAAARAQEKLGWKHELSLEADRRSPSLSPHGRGRRGLCPHPLGREAEVKLSFAPEGEGRSAPSKSAAARALDRSPHRRAAAKPLATSRRCNDRAQPNQGGAAVQRAFVVPGLHCAGCISKIENGLAPWPASPPRG
jgi:hypothetical protein